MEIGDAIRRKGKEEIVIKSIVWNTLIEFFKCELQVDIKPYLKSVKIKGKTFLIKTNKPVVNIEAYNNNDKIKIILEKKFEKIGIKFYDFEIKYL